MAFGVHIIREIGLVMKYPSSMTDDSINMLCNLLADNIGISRQSVYNDAHRVHDNLPADYITGLQDSGIIEQLARELVNANILKSA